MPFISHANDLLPPQPPADYPCQQGLVRVVAVTSDHVHYGTPNDGQFPPCERATIDLLIDGCPYRITVGSFVDGLAERRGLHVASTDRLIVQSTGIKAASVWPLRMKSPVHLMTTRGSMLSADRTPQLMQEAPAPTAKDRLLHEMGTEYHTRCEAYDKTVCSHRTPRGTAMPANYQERRLIQQNADRVRSQLLDRVREKWADLGITPRDLDRAIQDAAPDEERG